MPAGELEILPAPGPVMLTESRKVGRKLAVTLRAAPIVSRHLAVPEHAPDQPTKRSVPTGWAVRVTRAPRVSVSEHVFVQVRCGAPTTTLPRPEMTTDSLGWALAAPAAETQIASATTIAARQADRPSLRRTARVSMESRPSGKRRMLGVRIDATMTRGAAARRYVRAGYMPQR